MLDIQFLSIFVYTDVLLNRRFGLSVVEGLRIVGDDERTGSNPDLTTNLNVHVGTRTITLFPESIK